MLLNNPVFGGEKSFRQCHFSQEAEKFRHLKRTGKTIKCDNEL